MRTLMHEAPPVETESATVPVATDAVWWTFPALAVHARLARIWLKGWLDEQRAGKEEQSFGALVAFSELVTNSVLHGAGPITVHVQLMGRRLLCEVTDRCVDLPLLLDVGPEDENHRGLSLVEALTSHWWVRAEPGGGKTTSFLVDLAEG